MMVLEWLRRNNPVFDENIRAYLMKQGPITGIEAAATDEPASATTPHPGARRDDRSLGVGSLKGK